MKITLPGRPRWGLRSWVSATGVALFLFAVAAVAIPSLGLSGTDVRWAVGDDAALAEAEISARDPLVVDDAAEDEITPAVGQGKTILISLTSSTQPAIAVATTSLEDNMSRHNLVEQAKQEIEACRDRFRQIHDYSCVFHKRERVDGELTHSHIMAMKVRTNPNSIYFKFVEPNRGREAIFEPAKNNGKIIAHEPGVLKILAGTMILDPKGTMAMEANRHPITEAGIGALIDTIIDRWRTELKPSEAVVEIHRHAKVGHRSCTMIGVRHTTRDDAFLFHHVKVFIDHELGIPIRFEAYDWPKHPGAEPELMEEYTYSDLKTDVGLTDLDSDPSNPHYSYGRF